MGFHQPTKDGYQENHLVMVMVMGFHPEKWWFTWKIRVIESIVRWPWKIPRARRISKPFAVYSVWDGTANPWVTSLYPSHTKPFRRYGWIILDHGFRGNMLEYVIWHQIYPLVIKHGVLENPPFLDCVPTRNLHLQGIFQLAVFDYQKVNIPSLWIQKQSEKVLNPPNDSKWHPKLFLSIDDG